MNILRFSGLSQNLTNLTDRERPRTIIMQLLRLLLSSGDVLLAVGLLGLLVRPLQHHLWIRLSVSLLLEMQPTPSIGRQVMP